MSGESSFDTQTNRIISHLYSDVKPEDLHVTDRSASDYKRILGLDQVPMIPNVRVLDVGGGNANIKAEDFGIQDGNLVRVDIDPRRPDVQKGNILQLPFQEAEFDEVWASFILKYVDSPVGSFAVNAKLRDAEEIAGGRRYIDNMATFLGLRAIGELLRVTKPRGRIRIASYVYDFKQSDAFRSLMLGLFSDKISGIKISGTKVNSMSFSSHPLKQEANIILEKLEDFSSKEYSEFLQQEYQKLIPPAFTKALLDAKRE